MIEIFKNKPPKGYYNLMKKYKNVIFKQKYSIDLLKSFLKEFPEEKRGRKKFKEKEIQNVKHLLYEKILQKGMRIDADCVGLINEKVDRENVIISASFFKKNG